MRLPVAVVLLGPAFVSVTSGQSRVPVALELSHRAPDRASYSSPAVDSAPRPNYVLPAFEVIGFNAALNLFDRSFLGEDYKTDLASIRRNLRRKWVIDGDPFNINQFMH